MPRATSEHEHVSSVMTTVLSCAGLCHTCAHHKAYKVLGQCMLLRSCSCLTVPFSTLVVIMLHCSCCNRVPSPLQVYIDCSDHMCVVHRSFFVLVYIRIRESSWIAAHSGDGWQIEFSGRFDTRCNRPTGDPSRTTVKSGLSYSCTTACNSTTLCARAHCCLGLDIRMPWANDDVCKWSLVCASTRAYMC